MLVVSFLLLFLLNVNYGHPAYDELMEEQGDDTAVVESVVREARAVGPSHIDDLLAPGVKKAYLHTYGDKKGDNGELQGYSKKMNDKGKDGYKHFDSYHKKDSDKYGYEIHSEFGKENKHKVDTGSKKQKHRAADKDGEESKNLYIFGESVEDKKNKKAVDDYDFGYYADSDDADGEAKSENYGEEASYEDDGDKESYNTEEGDEEESAGNAEEQDEDY